MQKQEELAMDQTAGQAQEAGEDKHVPGALFSAVLTPHRSLSPKGFFFLMAAVGGVSFAAGLAFLVAGAWPVFGFLGLDVLLIYWAFRLNYHAAKVHEKVDLTDDKLTVTRVMPSGRQKSWEFNPYWVRCKLLSRPGRVSQLSLSSHGRTLVFGTFLSPEEKEDFAMVLSGALHEARGGSRI